MDNLNVIERDFVEFIAQIRERPTEDVGARFVRLRNRLDWFAGPRFLQLLGDASAAYELLNDARNEKEAITAYQHQALLHLLRYLSYSYPKRPRAYWDDLKRDLRRGEFRNIRRFIKQKIASPRDKTKNQQSTDAFRGRVLKQLGDAPVIVDYGCGLGYLSFDLAQKKGNSKVYLLDVDMLILDFAFYRFTKHGLNTEAIRVTPSTPYPTLPAHDLCIATEVMEHLHDPLRAYRNILETMRPGGLLYGNFEDHEPHALHVSPNLGALRRCIAQDFEMIEPKLYRRKNV